MSIKTQMLQNGNCYYEGLKSDVIDHLYEEFQLSDDDLSKQQIEKGLHSIHDDCDGKITLDLQKEVYILAW